MRYWATGRLVPGLSHPGLLKLALVRLDLVRLNSSGKLTGSVTILAFPGPVGACPCIH